MLFSPAYEYDFVVGFIFARRTRSDVRFFDAL